MLIVLYLCITYIVLCTKKPHLKDLQNCITINYATRWREIGIGLELTKQRLDIIEADHINKSEERCTAMLSRWLEEKADTATWKKLLSVLDSPAVSSTHRIKSVVTISPGKLG